MMIDKNRELFDLDILVHQMISGNIESLVKSSEYLSSMHVMECGTHRL